MIPTANDNLPPPDFANDREREAFQNADHFLTIYGTFKKRTKDKHDSYRAAYSFAEKVKVVSKRPVMIYAVDKGGWAAHVKNV